MLDITAPPTPIRRDPFARVLALLGDTRSSMEAAVEAAALLPPSGRLILAAVADTAKGDRAGIAPRRIARELRRSALAMLAEAQLACHAGAGHLLVGDPVHAGLAVARSESATLVAVRGPDPGRPFTGAVAAGVLRGSPGSVLVTRGGGNGDPPGRIVAGVDGSAGAARAAEVAVSLAARTGAMLTLIAATGGRPIDLERVWRRHPGIRIDRRPATDALVEASAGADLIVVGSRGLHGVALLGSVGDRVSARAACSVLTVR